MKLLNEFLNEEAESKSQRRLFGMALAYKRGELDDKDVSDKIIELSKLPEDQLKDYAKTKEDKLPEKIDERKTVQVKRKYSQHDSVSVGANAPVRSSILGFISEKGSCTKDELKQYICSKNEESGTNTNHKWIKNNSKYITEFEKDNQTYYKLSKLGLRVVKATNVNESFKLLELYMSLSSNLILEFISSNNIDVNNLINYLETSSVSETINTSLVFANMVSIEEKESFLSKFQIA